MNIPEKHFKETKRLLKAIHRNEISRWLLKEGYYPEQYVIPPTFQVQQFPLKPSPYYSVKINKSLQSFNPDKFEEVNVSYPKSSLTERNFGIIHPKIYHDIVWNLNRAWDTIVDHIFDKKINIFSYSFPIPITNKAEGILGNLRAGRMIYEFVEMAEKDLVAEAHDYNFILRTDIKNFYPSIYTHSIAWAIHTKAIIRKKGNKSDFNNFVGLKLDRLLQCANDGCTNGIAIGSAISDLIAEVILAAVDKDCSIELKKRRLKFLGVRFKDDYRILCNSKEDGNRIIKVLQAKMKEYNLSLNEKKSEIHELPEGLFREWPAEYRKCSLKYSSKIKYTRLADTFLSTLKIDMQYPDTGVIDKFLSELTTKKYKLKLKLNEKYSQKAFNLLLLLKGRRAKSFPHILGIIQKIIEENKSNKGLIKYITFSLKKMLTAKFKNEQENLYDLIWLIYFVRSENIFPVVYPKTVRSKLIQSLRSNSFALFTSMPIEFKLFNTIKSPSRNVELLEYLDLFKRQ
jgi:hypothetical protein